MTPVQTALLVTSPTCPLCHTFDDTITTDALQAGATWACKTCGQTWSAERLARAAAYAEYSATY